jgi:hypothetical protein
VAGNDMGVFALLDVLDKERGVVLGKTLKSRKEKLISYLVAGIG